MPPADALRHNHDTQTPCLTNNTPRDTLQSQPTQSRLAVFYLRNLVYMFETDGPHGALGCIANCGTVRAGLARLPIVVIHRPRHIAGTANLALCRQDASSAEE